MSSRSPQFGRTGSKEPRVTANNADDRLKARHDDNNRRHRLGMATRDMNRLAGSLKPNDK